MTRPSPIMRHRHPELVRQRSTDPRPSVPQIAPATYLEGQTFATFAEAVASDRELLERPPVTEASLRGLPAATFARNRIANAVASMSPMRMVDETTRRVADFQPDVVRRPLATLGIFDYWRDAIGHAITRGNFVGLPIDLDPATGEPRQVLPVNCDWVHCYVDGAGFTVYEILGRKFSVEEVIHVRGPHTSPGQPWALSPVQVFRQAIGEAVDVQTYGAESFRMSSVPSVAVVLDREGPIPQPVMDSIADGWISRYGAAKRRPAILPKTMAVTPLSFSPHDAEFIEAKRLTIAEAALMFDLSPADLNVTIGGDSQTYANITDRQNGRIVETYQPWMRGFEEAWGDLVPDGYECEFDPERSYRMTPREHAEVQEIRIRSGVSTVDEEREAMGRDPLPPKPEPAPPAPPPVLELEPPTDPTEEEDQP